MSVACAPPIAGSARSCVNIVEIVSAVSVRGMDTQALHGDGSFGMNAMEFDTAMRHNLPILTVISQNGGWTADPDKDKPGRALGYPRLDKFGEAFGGHGEHVTNPDDIRPAIERAKKAMAAGKAALVCVVTDHNARAATAVFTNYST
jgi:thiamine pyrophosphate-dependent acetolactate synthase large subunit-like protein